MFGSNQVTINPKKTLPPEKNKRQVFDFQDSINFITFLFSKVSEEVLWIDIPKCLERENNHDDEFIFNNGEEKRADIYLVLYNISFERLHKRIHQGFIILGGSFCLKYNDRNVLCNIQKTSM